MLFINFKFNKIIKSKFTSTKKHIPKLSIFFIIIYFIAINSQFYILSYFSYANIYLVILICFGINVLAALSVFFSKNKIWVKLLLFMLIPSIFFIFRPINFTANNLPGYFKKNEPSFNKLIQLIEMDSIRHIEFCHVIFVDWKRRDNYETVKSLNCNILVNEINKLKITEIKIDGQNYLFLFDDNVSFGLVKIKTSVNYLFKGFYTKRIYLKKIRDDWYYVVRY